MDPQRFLCWRVLLLLLSTPCGLLVSVHILDEQPVYVIPGSSLVLRARVDPGHPQAPPAVTWEREPESGARAARETLATCPGGNGGCAGARPGVLAGVEQLEATLQVSGYGRADGGVYAVTVRDREGATATARCIVREYEAVHHVSIGVNASHSALVCGEAWGTEPRFRWLHERAAVTGAVGRVSGDGSTLLVTMTPICGHFTCMVSNKLGSSSATYSAAPCAAAAGGATAAVACLAVVMLLLGGALAFLLFRRYRRSKRGKRLQEHVDEAM